MLAHKDCAVSGCGLITISSSPPSIPTNQWVLCTKCWAAVLHAQMLPDSASRASICCTSAGKPNAILHLWSSFGANAHPSHTHCATAPNTETAKAIALACVPATALLIYLWKSRLGCLGSVHWITLAHSQTRPHAPGPPCRSRVYGDPCTRGRPGFSIHLPPIFATEAPLPIAIK